MAIASVASDAASKFGATSVIRCRRPSWMIQLSARGGGAGQLPGRGGRRQSRTSRAWWGPRAGRSATDFRRVRFRTATLGPMLGTSGRCGRCRTRANTSVNSALVTGSGAVRLTGPVMPAVRRCSIAPISSSMLIQLSHWRPVPNRPPSPSLNNGSCLARAPPCRAEHEPGAQLSDRDAGGRRWLGRRLPRPTEVGEESLAFRRRLVEHLVAARPVDTDRRRRQQNAMAVGRGRRACERAVRSASCGSRQAPPCVPTSSACRRCRHRRGGPRRRQPSKSADGSSPAVGSQRISPAPAGVRTRRITLWPAAARRAISAEPIRPLAPDTTTVFGCGFIGRPSALIVAGGVLTVAIRCNPTRGMTPNQWSGERSGTCRVSPVDVTNPPEREN